MSWMIYLLITVLSFSALNLIQRAVAVDSPFPRATGIVFNAVVIVMMMVAYGVTQQGQTVVWPTQIQAWIGFGVAVLAYGLFERGRFTASKLVDASTSSIISTIAVVVALAVSFVVYQETLTWPKFLGSTIIVVSLLLVSWQGKIKTVSTKGILFCLAVYAVVGVAWSMDKLGATYFGTSVYSTLMWIVPFGIIVLPKVPFAELKVAIKHQPGWTVVMAALNAVGYFAQLKAFSLADATVVIPLAQTSTLLTVLAGIIFLKERSHVPLKIVSGVLCLIGVWLVAS